MTEMTARQNDARRLKLPAILGATLAAVAGVAFVATNANAATETPAPAPPATHACSCDGELAENPEAAAEMQAVRGDFFEARQAWFDKYGADRGSDEAQAALQQLRDDHTAKTQAVFDKYGIDATAGSHAGGMGHGMGGGMMGGGACDSGTTTN